MLEALECGEIEYSYPTGKRKICDSVFLHDCKKCMKHCRCKKGAGDGKGNNAERTGEVSSHAVPHSEKSGLARDSPADAPPNSPAPERICANCGVVESLHFLPSDKNVPKDACVFKYAPEMELEYCKKCVQMTNHIGNECQKCKEKEFYMCIQKR